MYKLYITNEVNENRDLGEYPTLEEAAARAREVDLKTDDWFDAFAKGSDEDSPDDVLAENEGLELTDGTSNWYWCEDGSCHGGGMVWRLETPE